ncbi:DUF4176 domain-containing protein [Ligilactobacillus pobuzihii]|uniref:DUF4176 domain-containing protein n=1 Tax=Ligilactobacillus pobuzihii TaxID=449659 RepID=UPI0019D26C2F|nr:DUF4176 domain-containing protein [Ligilactobacillus pobuzihii]MBN7274917.1 DUF4176 domain-containing protein [Ligilactobacillus pobuzihii]
MKRDLLPLGSIVQIKGEKKKLMIAGRRMEITDDDGDEVEKDYLAFRYPKGSQEAPVFFNENKITVVIFKGYSNEEDQEYLEGSWLDKLYEIISLKLPKLVSWSLNIVNFLINFGISFAFSEDHRTLAKWVFFFSFMFLYVLFRLPIYVYKRKKGLPIKLDDEVEDEDYDDEDDYGD